MSERSTFDLFEQRIAEELERYVAPAVDPRPATEIAEAAMRPRSLVTQTRNLSRPRRLFLLGLAAALLLPAAYIVGTTRPPAPDLVIVVPPPATDDPRATAAPSAPISLGASAIFVRRHEGPEPGVSIFAVRADGSESLVRKVPDSILTAGGKIGEWGAVSGSGWLAMGAQVQGGPWPMILLDLSDENAQPWVADEANTGGIGPRWGPTGLVAADAGSNGGRVVIIDPETQTSRIVSMHGGLVGGGPSIIWTADGSGIVGSYGSDSGGPYGNGFQIVPIDGGDPRSGVEPLFDPHGGYGPGMAQLRICSPDAQCPGGNDGRIERVELDGSVRTIWQQHGTDRALAASFGDRPEEYWLTLDHDSGRQVSFVHVHDGREDAVATVNRDATWQFIQAPQAAHDSSMAAVFIDVGAKPAALLIPLTSGPPTFHAGLFAGFVDGNASAALTTGQFVAPAATLQPTGAPYALPAVDDLIAAELGLNPGRTVLGKASRDAIDGDTAVRTFEIARDRPIPGEAYVDCFGPSSVTVTSGSQSVTSPCLRAGAYVLATEATGPIVVTASGDTSWRVVVYAP